MTDTIRVALVGCGATGLEIGRSLAGRSGAELVAAVDTDPAKAGRPLGELLGTGPGGPSVRADLAGLTGEDVDVAVLTVGSTVASVTPALERLAAAGIDVISLCEELAYPWFDDPDGAGRLLRHAERHGTSILATGCNPGFLMDTLPIVVSASIQAVERVSIERTTDLSAYGPLLGKFGFGLSPEEHAARTSGDVVGHIGFRQSIAHLAHALGLELEAIEVDAPEPLVVAGAERRGAILRIPAGTVAAVRHGARGIVDGEAAISCLATFGFLAPEDGLERGDRWRFEGGGRTIELASATGFDSWETTIAVLVNLIGAVGDAPAGLLTMSDIPVGALAAKGSRLAPGPSPADAGRGRAGAVIRRQGAAVTDPHAASRAAAERARRIIPRGVSSAMRAEQRPVPLQVTRARGSRVWDADGHEYVDYVLGFGAAFLGHAPAAVAEAVASEVHGGFAPGAPHAGEAEFAKQVIGCVPSAEMVAPMTTGSEAVHAAVRLARAATGRRQVVKFAGHYHGWLDPVFVAGPGSPAITQPQSGGAPGTLGVHDDGSVIVCPFNDAGALEQVLGSHPVAAVLMEPVPCNFGTFEPAPGYLETVRRLCDDSGAVLVFDEVITGFRLALGGAQERYGVLPDLTVLSKGIASGMPVAALAGRERVMRTAADGMRMVGTYNGTPVPLAAARATLRELSERAPVLYPALDALSGELAAGLRALGERHGVPLVVQQIGAVLQLLWGPRVPVRSYADASVHDRAEIGRLSELLVGEGVNSLARGLWFVSAAHGAEDLERTLAAADRALARMPAGVTS